MDTSSKTEARSRESETAKRVVVGVDGSASSRRALRWALDQAELIGAGVEVVFAWDYPWLWSADEEDTVPEYMWNPEDDGRRMLRDVFIEVVGSHPAVPVSAHAVQGGAARALLAAAEGAELLVVGSRGHGTLTGMVLGSVSLRVAHRAPCPVVIIHDTPKNEPGVDAISSADPGPRAT